MKGIKVKTVSSLLLLLFVLFSCMHQEQRREDISANESGVSASEYSRLIEAWKNRFHLDVEGVLIDTSSKGDLTLIFDTCQCWKISTLLSNEYSVFLASDIFEIYSDINIVSVYIKYYVNGREFVREFLHSRSANRSLSDYTLNYSKMLIEVSEFYSENELSLIEIISDEYINKEHREDGKMVFWDILRDYSNGTSTNVRDAKLGMEVVCYLILNNPVQQLGLPNRISDDCARMAAARDSLLAE